MIDKDLVAVIVLTGCAWHMAFINAILMHYYESPYLSHLSLTGLLIMIYIIVTRHDSLTGHESYYNTQE